MKRVLVVDDDGVLRTDLALTLSSWGFDVRVAGGGLEGVRLINGWRPDLVLCDVRMPNIAGSEVRRYLNNMRSIYSDIMFFFISAIPEKELESLSKSQHADDWLAKPIQMDVLKYKIEKHLGSGRISDGSASVARPMIFTTMCLIASLILAHYAFA